MNKIEFYKEMYKTVNMVELILKKFNNDMLDNDVMSCIITCHPDHFTVMVPMVENVVSTDVLDMVKESEYVLNTLKITNKHNHMGWDPYLTSLKLGFEKISNLLKEEVE